MAAGAAAAGAAVPSQDVLSKELILSDLLDHHEQDDLAKQANMYATLRQLDFIENANAVGVFNDTPEVYEKACDERLRQYNIAKDNIRDFDLSKFLVDYDLQLDAVEKRITVGMNANRQYEQDERARQAELHRSENAIRNGIEAGQVIVNLQGMLTPMDDEEVTAGMILGPLGELVRIIDKIPSLHASAELATMRKWEAKMLASASTDVISDAEALEIIHDIDKVDNKAKRMT